MFSSISHPASGPSQTMAQGRALSSQRLVRVAYVLLTCSVLTLSAHAQADAPKNIADATAAALKSDWLQPERVDKILKVFGIMVQSSAVPFRVNSEVLALLNKTSPENSWLYRAALGDPDKYGQPQTPGAADFLDTLAKANTLKLKKPADETYLFGGTQTLINEIFQTGPGKLSLLKINDAFNNSNKYLALFKLLEAYWEWAENTSPEAKRTYPLDLEKFRAAFEMNEPRLAKQVAATINSARD